MKNYNRTIALVFALSAFVFANEAHAQTVGAMIKNTADSFEKLPGLLNFIAYFSGLLLTVIGLFKFKDHVDNPRETKLSEGIKRFVAGGLFLSGPYMMRALYATLYGDANYGSRQITDTGRTNAVLTPGGLDEMIVNLMINIGKPIELLLTSFTYIAAITLLLVGISRLTKRMEEGPRGPAGMGTIMTFLVSGALFSFADMMGVFSSSMFGDTTVMTNADIDGAVMAVAADREKVEAVIESLMAFIMIVGYIAFIRGWFVLRAFADGQNGATLAQGLTFLFGGALAINLGELVNLLQTTVGISGITFG